MKRIVVCEDGTWNVPDRKDGNEVCPSNVAKLALAVAREDAQGVKQIVRYHPGVGTGKWDRIRGGAFGRGLSQHVQDAYLAIVEEFEPGDEIFLFGFSRGAFTARSTAGLIRNAGVLTRADIDRVKVAYDFYRSRKSETKPREIEAQLFRRQYSYETRIKFIGVWDTVGAYGIPEVPWLPISFERLNKHWSFHDTDLSTSVDHAYQALAIDERRAQFKPTLWKRQDGAPDEQQLEQVWFAGVHSNIGGGYNDRGLSNITLKWMKEKAEVCGLTFIPEFNDEQFPSNHLGAIRDSRVGLYKLPFLPGPYDRPIGTEPRGNESVHPSVLQRRTDAVDPVYEPPELVKFLGTQGAGDPGL